MKLSWSHKLFLCINAQIGKRPLLDRFMVFCARWLIFILLAVVAVEGWRWEDAYETYEWVAWFFLFVMIVLALGMNWLIALFWKRPRPQAEFPEEVKTLVRAYQTFKTFPSDHTTIATILAIASVFVSSWYPLLIFGSILVAVSRVYVGLHYPRDIIGGIVSGGVFFYVGGYAAITSLFIMGY